MDPPSAQLVEQLTELGLARPRDLKHCRRHVRRLARDLPTFDSVWIDALVQERRLTPFQARMLESAHSDRLAVGPCVLVDRIGSDGRFTSYRALRRDTRRCVLLTFLTSDSDSLDSIADRLRTFLDETKGLSHPGLSLAFGCSVEAEAVIAVSPWVEGPTLRELLLRRGRFSHEIVSDLAFQITDVLGSLAGRGLQHGDLRLHNIRLSPRGQIVLVNAGLLSALSQGLSIHSNLPPDCYDAIAPELIETGRDASPAADAYALGCVLWELLAGRPPFPHGDPLAKLAAHQTQTIPDIEAFAPDTPPQLANLIRSLTARNPEDRATDFSAIARGLRRSRRAARRRLARFLDAFKVSARSTTADPRRRSLVGRAALVAGVILAVSSLALLDAGARSEILAIVGSAPERLREQLTSLVAADSDRPPVELQAAESQLLPFPTQVVDGAITLDSNGPYAPGEVAAVGPLVIRAAPNVHPVVVVGDQPLHVWAESLVLEQITFRFGEPAAETASLTPESADSPALVVVDAESFAARKCTFDCRDRSGAPAAIQWRPLDTVSATGKRIILVESVFLGSGAAVRSFAVPTSVTAENVLKCGRGPLVEIAAHAVESRRGLNLTARRTTLRGPSSLIRWSRESANVSIAPLVITLEESVFDLPSGEAALIEFDSPPPSAQWQKWIRITGQGSLVRPGAAIAGAVDSTSQGVQPLEIDDLSIDGLLGTDFNFSGPPDDDPRNSMITGYLGYGHSMNPPGADAQSLPSPSRDVYNSSHPASDGRQPTVGSE